MKFIYSLLAALIILSCSNESSTLQQITSENIIGTWIIKAIDNEEVYTNEQFACRFNSNGMQDYLAIVDNGDGSSYFSYTDFATYSVTDGTIYLVSSILELKISGAINYGELCGEMGDILIYSESINVQQGEDVNENRTFTAIRTWADYSDDIIGLWEGEVISGDTSEPFDNIRLEFKAGGTFDFYKKESSDNDWVLLEQDNTYATVGTLLSTQWSEDDQTTVAETWEISISGNSMTWRATREGINYQTGFDLVKL
ncbi:MAG: hypothetical protein SNJ33_03440 [Rikenellaceae bacterium]